MSYLILHRPYANGNTSWKFVKRVRFASVGFTELERRTRGLKVKDLYCLVPPEGVSDIPAHVHWLGVVMPNRRIVEYTTFHQSDKNWLEMYEGVETQGEDLMRSIEFIDTKILVQIGLDCLRTMFPLHPKITTEILAAVQACELWIQDKVSVGELQAHSDAIGSRSMIRQATHSILMAIVDSENSTAAGRIRDTLEISAEAWGNASDVLEKKLLFAEIIRHHVPMADAMVSRLLHMKA